MRLRIVSFLTLGLVTVMVMTVPDASVKAQQEPNTARIERTQGDVVGASISHPAGWFVEREPYTYEGTYGYTLWRPESGDEHDHGGTPAVRVALAYDLEPSQIEDKVRETLTYYEDGGLPVERAEVSVGEQGHRGVAVGPIPGSTPSTEVYVPVNGRVYRINVYSEEPGEERLDADDDELLSGIRFEPPSRAVEALGLQRANAPEALYPSEAEALALRTQEDAKAPAGFAATASEEGETPEMASRTASATGETRISEGCWRAYPRFFVQTQHGYKANGNHGDGIPTGWSVIGLPNFWGQYTHGNLDYGRCTEPNYTNDKFAVDYPLNKWDYVFSPFSCGRVTHAGRNQTHADYGIFVSIKACNGKYVNLTAHLVALKDGLRRGDKVTKNTVIGYAGKTGGGKIPVGRVHIHTAFYRHPKQTQDGSPYGGAGLQVVRNRYVGTAAKRRSIFIPRHASSRVYDYAKVKPRNVFCRESTKCGERYMVSN